MCSYISLLPPASKVVRSQTKLTCLFFHDGFDSFECMQPIFVQQLDACRFLQFQYVEWMSHAAHHACVTKDADTRGARLVHNICMMMS